MSLDSVPSLSLLAGGSLTVVTAREYDWVFVFSNKMSLVAESSHWRLIENGKVIVTDEDHGQLFGHDKPVEAAVVVQARLGGVAVDRVELSRVSDLLLSFANGCILEVLVSSSGYENWHVYGGPDGLHIFAIGGGELCCQVP